MSGGETGARDLVDREVFDSVAELSRAFQAGRPFRHVVIDNFLKGEFCEAVCEQFPGFGEAHAINENEKVGGKATRETVRTLGQAFRQMDDLVRHPEFLTLVQNITGIEDLQYDPFYFGGGTHENLEGQDLDPHIDFNFHPVTSQHRRLNLIIYLNDGWRKEWGGCLQLHRDPYLEPCEDEIVTVEPLLNRCVIFETSEHSWHGFERIALPQDKKHLSRKSFAVYYYTDKRPPSETGEEHSTIYVERHLPERFRNEMVLSDEDINEIKALLKRRDEHLQRLYRDLQEERRKLNELYYSAGRTATPIKRLEDVPTDLKSAVRMIQVLRGRVDAMEASTSWRLTAPVRAVKRLLTGKG
jgi:Rps23 Pro-64 3,4-dihydroxylase Tpa1-like proline 4-hydroxylase